MPEALVLSAVVAAFAISAMAIAFFIVGAAELQ
jgi:multisubunit Na+/H+ antiporter MnhC subunit